MRYWEDFELGSVETFGAYEVTEAEIIKFGTAYDPMPYHIDPEAGAASAYGSLTAPGLLVCSIFMRMTVDHILVDAASMGSPGVDSVRWKLPVRPGDILSASQEVVATRVLKSRPEMGLVKNRFGILNQRGEEVAEIYSNGLFQRRAALEAGDSA